jgi:hypothetical protein
MEKAASEEVGIIRQQLADASSFITLPLGQEKGMPLNNSIDLWRANIMEARGAR